MKPVDLCGYLIKNSSKKSDVVLDPFLGSGSTLIACDQLDRTCYGVELDPEYCQVIMRRYSVYCAQGDKKCKILVNGKAFSFPSEE